MFEDGGSFHEASGKCPDEFSRMPRVIRCQLRNVCCAIFFRRINVVGLAVVIHKNGHVPAHLSFFKILLEHILGTYAFGQCAGSQAGYSFECLHGLVLFIHVQGPFARIDSPGLQELEWPCGFCCRCHPRVSGSISFPLEFQVEPHHVLSGLFVVNHFGAFQDAALGDGVGMVPLHHLQGDSFVLPVIEVFGGIAVNPYLGIVSCVPLHLVFPVPVIGSLVVQDAAAVGVDVRAVVVRPDFSGSEGSMFNWGFCGGDGSRTVKQAERQKRFHGIYHGRDSVEIEDGEGSGWPYSLSQARERAYRAYPVP